MYILFVFTQIVIYHCYMSCEVYNLCYIYIQAKFILQYKTLLCNIKIGMLYDRIYAVCYICTIM